jgi:hypothetical protein
VDALGHPEATVLHVDGLDGGRSWLWVRVALVVFVLVWILGPSELRDAIPILPVFLVALGLEVHFLASALRGRPRPTPDRLPQDVDRERYGFEPEPDEIMVIDNGHDEVWLAVPGEAEDDDTPDDEHVEDDAPVEPEPRSRLAPVRRFALGLGVIAGLLLLIWFVESRTGWDSLAGETRATAVARFSDEASRIAEKPVSIRCDESRDYVGAVQHADGVAVVGGDLAIVTPEICHDLYRLAFEEETTGSRTGRALAVLAHEAWHLRGERDEGTTECYALQTGVELGIRLGLSEGTAAQLMRQQLAENALRGVGSLEYRVPSECHDGSRLDLDPASTDFP